MPATYIEFNTSGLFYGWTSEEMAALDKDATEKSLVAILQDIAPEAEIVIRWEDGNDKIEGEWRHATELDDLRREISDYPWSDAQRWAVFND